MKTRTGTHYVDFSYSRDESVQLFHDINRVLSLLDDVAPAWDEDASPQDLESYRRLHQLAETLQRELQIEPEGSNGQAHQPDREDGA